MTGHGSTATKPCSASRGSRRTRSANSCTTSRRTRAMRCSTSTRTSRSSPSRSLSYLSLTERDRDEMLATIGVASVEELFRDIPAGLRMDRELSLGPPLTEQELSRHLEELAARN